MSQVLNLISKVHGAQLKVVAKGHDGLLKAVDQLSQLQGKFATSRKPSGVSVTLASVIGRPTEFLRYGAQSAADWAKLSESFQSKLASAIDVKTPSTAGKSPTGEPSSSRRNGSHRASRRGSSAVKIPPPPPAGPPSRTRSSAGAQPRSRLPRPPVRRLPVRPALCPPRPTPRVRPEEDVSRL